MKRSFKFWLSGLAVLLALGGTVPAQACWFPGKLAIQAVRQVRENVSQRVELRRTSRPCNRIEADPGPVQHWAPSRGLRAGGCLGGSCLQ